MSTSQSSLPEPSEYFQHWPLRPDVVHLDHGSCGGCPTSILNWQNDCRFELEASPPDYYMRQYHGRLKEAKSALGRYLNADTAGLSLMPGTTLGLNVIAQSQSFEPDDELIITNHAYATATKLLQHMADRDHAKLVKVDVPYPVSSGKEILDVLLRAVTPRTKFALIDHIPSRTALVYPIKEICAAFKQRGIDVLVDGAHGPGQIPVDLTDMDCPYYVASCHKWMCAPRGLGMMYIRPDKLDIIKPLVVARTTYGRDPKPESHSWFEHHFDWFGTFDPSAFAMVPKIINFLETLVPGGDAARMQMNHQLALRARKVVFEKLNIPLPCPEDLVGAMVAIPLPEARYENKPGFTPIQALMWEKYRIEIQAYHWPKYPRRLLRFSCQSHNSIEQYEYLANALLEGLAEEREVAANMEGA